MPRLEVTVNQVIELIKQLSFEDKLSVLSVLDIEVGYTSSESDPETQEWLEADLSGELPPYEWGTQGIPPGKPVRYLHSVGFIVEGSKTGVE